MAERHQTLIISQFLWIRNWSLAGCPWLKDSREVVVKLSAGAVVSYENSTETEGICFPTHTHGFWPSSALSTGLPYDIMAVGFAQVNDPRESYREWAPTGEPQSFIYVTSEMISHHICHTLFIINESICPAYLHSSKEDYTNRRIPGGGVHWLFVWQGHVGSWNKSWNLRAKAS